MDRPEQLFRHTVLLAPMAGVTDKPFRQLCRALGADAAVSEMTSSNPALRTSRKTRLRLDHDGETSPRIVQIAGADPAAMATAARYGIEHGADIIDINMGCPAKKVCNVQAGSALLRDESLVARILTSVVNAAGTVPVTLKMRTGWDTDNRNALRIARIAEATGIRRLAIHGRTRACGYKGEAEYHTIAEVKSRIALPVIANGDIDSAYKAAEVLRLTGADGVMIGRAAQGNPWLFREIKHYLATGARAARPTMAEIGHTLGRYLQSLYDFYGEHQGVRIARKHIGWFCRGTRQAEWLKSRVNRTQDCAVQLQLVKDYFALIQEPGMRQAA